MNTQPPNLPGYQSDFLGNEKNMLSLPWTLPKNNATNQSNFHDVVARYVAEIVMYFATYR